MSSKFKIGEVILKILEGSENVISMVDKRIFPVVAVKKTSEDYILYSRDKYARIANKMGAFDQCHILIVAVSDNYERSMNLAVYINEALEGNFSNPKMKISLMDSTEDFEDGKYIQVILYSIE